MSNTMTVGKLVKLLNKWDPNSPIDICVTEKKVTRKNLLSVRGVQASIEHVDLCCENPDGPPFVMITGIITNNEFIDED